MDIRRPPPRSSSGGVEPRFRQVGFVTSAEPGPAAASPAPAAGASPPASDGLSPVMIPPPLIPDHLPAPGSESLMPSSPPPASSSLLDAASDLGDDDDEVDVSWARPPPPALPGTPYAISQLCTLRSSQYAIAIVSICSVSINLGI